VQQAFKHQRYRHIPKEGVSIQDKMDLDETETTDNKSSTSLQEPTKTTTSTKKNKKRKKEESQQSATSLAPLRSPKRLQFRRPKS
jgi:hypothetical protein